MTITAPRDASTSRRRALIALVLPVALAFVLLGTSAAFGITRNSVLSRAQRRVDAPVPYSQSKYYAGYRTDCSGYVSMAWGTGTSWNTRTFHNVTHRIAVSSLKPGDALLKKGYHIRLFYGWLNEARTHYISYESAYGTVAGTRIHAIADDLRFGYIPVRYDRIKSSPASRNVLKNPTFNVWAKSWSRATPEPSWWQISGEPGQVLFAQRKDVYRTASNSLELRNRSGDPAQVTELAQVVRVVPGAPYQASAYAKSAADPFAIDFALVYVDALGEVVAEKRVTGVQAGINDSGFRRMSVLETAPVDAVAARVSVNLTGGGTTTPTGVVPGTSVLIDDVSLVRPYVSVGIKTNRTTAYNKKTAYLSGAVSPKSAVGAPVTVYVKTPGRAWKKLTTTSVVLSNGSAVWRAKYRFTRSMPRGRYGFKASVGAIPGHLGSTSGTVKVRLR